MGLECKSRSNIVILAETIIDSCILLSNSKLLTNHATVICYLVWVPRCKAKRVSVVGALYKTVCSCIEGPVKVQFLAWIVVIDGFPVSGHVVDAVFYRVDGAGCGILGYTC